MLSTWIFTCHFIPPYKIKSSHNLNCSFNKLTGFILLLKLGEELIYEAAEDTYFPHFYGPDRSFRPLSLDVVSKAEKLELKNAEFTCSLLDQAWSWFCFFNSQINFCIRLQTIVIMKILIDFWMKMFEIAELSSMFWWSSPIFSEPLALEWVWDHELLQLASADLQCGYEQQPRWVFRCSMDIDVWNFTI